MKKKVLIVGYGSIGKKHARILKKLNIVSKIYVLTKQNCKKFIKIKNFKEIKNIDPDYIIIASRTSDHYKHLLLIEKILKNKIILVEKPLFKDFKRIKIKRNKVFVGYNLRYHPIIKFIKNFIEKRKIFSVHINCHSYLPNWRKGVDYSKSNTAKKKYGGGALLELSHELDYLQLIFDKIYKLNHVIVKKISNLKINTDDYVNIIGKTIKSNFCVNLNLFSLQIQRRIMINGKGFSLEGDLIENTIRIFEKNKKKIKKFKVDTEYTYKAQHKSLLSNVCENSCTYRQGVQLMLIINKIKNLNK